MYARIRSSCLSTVFATAAAGFIVGAVPVQTASASPFQDPHGLPLSGDATETLVYSFGGGTDGAYPLAALIDVGGTLFGTTDSGGSTNCGGSGCGSVFSLDPSTRAEKVLSSLCNGSTCALEPNANLLDFRGTLYGTASYGPGTNCSGAGCGVVFSVNPTTGAEQVSYPFCSRESCADGWSPWAGLINVRGTLYGTTELGGANCASAGGCGTVFALDPKTGVETVIYSFCSQSNCTDGAFPEANLINVGGTLYGTTYSGGVAGCTGDGCGTVFSVNPTTGAEKVLYSFCSQTNCADGAEPGGSLIEFRDALYGVTARGGTGSGEDCTPYAGCGTVFAVDPATGTETVVYSFCSQQNCVDGRAPLANLTKVDGVLYGTTELGGANYENCDLGCGTVFSLDAKTRAETVLYSFCSQVYCVDGEAPAAGLIDVGATLYGTTIFGGLYGYGTVFSITP
jgi:uncharacterized repeat protein (TIGR03803 family)